MVILQLLTIFAGIASLFVVGVQGVCETNVEETAKRCLSRSMTPTISSGDLLRKDITSLTPGQMKELCQLFRNFEDCIQEELYACIDNKHELKKILESFEHSFNYICHEGFELLMKIKPCTEKPEFKKQMGQCSESAIYRFNETKMRLMTNYMIKEKACRYLHETMECIENVAFALCGEDARTYYRELNVRVLAPTTDHLRCSERNFSLIGLGIFVALILALVVLMVRRYLRKRQMSQEMIPDTIITTRIRPPRMINPRRIPGGMHVVTATGTRCHSQLVNERTNDPIQYPQAESSYVYNQPCTFQYNELDKNDFSVPPPSYEQVMAEKRNQPKPL